MNRVQLSKQQPQSESKNTKIKHYWIHKDLTTVICKKKRKKKKDFKPNKRQKKYINK